MSPKKNSVGNLVAFLSAIVAVTGLATGAVHVGDKHYVLADTFTTYQQGQHENRKMDSIIHAYELDKLNSVKADVDTIKRMLRNRR